MRKDLLYPNVWRHLENQNIEPYILKTTLQIAKARKFCTVIGADVSGSVQVGKLFGMQFLVGGMGAHVGSCKSSDGRIALIFLPTKNEVVTVGLGVATDVLVQHFNIYDENHYMSESWGFHLGPGIRIPALSTDQV